MELRKYTQLSLLLALSVVLNLIESVIPLFNGFIPGLKLGLANTVILFALFTYSFKDALYISIIRVFIVGILRTGLFSVNFFFSLGGAILSITSMSIMKKVTHLSIVGISIVGSIFHSLGQIIIAIIFVKNMNMIYYVPWILLFAIPTGIITGMITKEILNYFEKSGIKY